ncbi:MAG: T9SS type A sorting domain-containing protein [Ignavibacteriales bacterium]|nr:MAG: T9SS type A sorting domain-containing protein [Ignavibacteriales bacterium]
MNNNVKLSWVTATEVNNRGFEVERKEVGSEKSAAGNDGWQSIGFVAGLGTTTAQHTYSFIDENLPSGRQGVLPGIYQYRLKQIDFDGSYEYSKIVEVDFSQPVTFLLEQNYPNPFNPSTKISFTIPLVETGHAPSLHVMLKIYDVLGNEIFTLINDEKPAGYYEVEFDAGKLSSGVYYYNLTAGSFSDTKKMLIIK